ncbi:MAG: hypothetical protein Tsb0018_07120 [Opitutales bacterium]
MHSQLDPTIGETAFIKDENLKIQVFYSQVKKTARKSPYKGELKALKRD